MSAIQIPEWQGSARLRWRWLASDDVHRVEQATRRRTIDPAMYVSMARMAPRSLSRQIRDSWLSMVVVIRCGYILAPCRSPNNIYLAGQSVK